MPVDGTTILVMALVIAVVAAVVLGLRRRARRVTELRWPANMDSRAFSNHVNRYFAALGWSKVAATHHSIDAHVEKGAASLMALCINPTLETEDTSFSLVKILSEVNTRTRRAFKDPLVFLTQGRMSDRSIQDLLEYGIVVVPYTRLPEVIEVVTDGTSDTTRPDTWQRLLLGSSPARCKALFEMYQEQGRLELALHWAEQFNVAWPNNTAGHLRVANFHFERQNYEAAEAAAQASLRLNRKVATLRVLSNIRRRIGDKAGAIEYARQSVEEGSTQAGAHVFYLELLLAYKEYGLARQAMQRAQTLVSDGTRLEPYAAKIAALP